MHDVDETPSAEPVVENDAELDQLESDLEGVDAALGALDNDDFEQAETLTAALAADPVADETSAQD